MSTNCESCRNAVTLTESGLCPFCSRRVSQTCASCIRPIPGRPFYEPIGRNDGIVALCSTCATAPVEYSDRPRYVEPEDNTLPTRAEVDAGMERVMGADAAKRERRTNRSAHYPRRKRKQ